MDLHPLEPINLLDLKLSGKVCYFSNYFSKFSIMSFRALWGHMLYGTTRLHIHNLFLKNRVRVYPGLIDLSMRRTRQDLAYKETTNDIYKVYEELCHKFGIL